MKIAADRRRLKTPQTTKTGMVRKDRKGNSIYTEYLKDITVSDRMRLTHHMTDRIRKIAELLEYDGAGFYSHTGIDPNARTQCNSEPKPYSFKERFDFVNNRLADGAELTYGIVDMYNEVVTTVQMAVDSDWDFIEECRVELVHPTRMHIQKNLNTALWSLK